MIGELDKQIVYDPETGQGTHYLFKSQTKEVRLDDVFEVLKDHHKKLGREEKKMIRDLCLMLSDGKISDTDDSKVKTQITRFATGFLLGKYSSNTDMEISAEKIVVSVEGDYDEPER